MYICVVQTNNIDNFTFPFQLVGYSLLLNFQCQKPKLNFLSRLHFIKRYGAMHIFQLKLTLAFLKKVQSMRETSLVTWQLHICLLMKVKKYPHQGTVALFPSGMKISMHFNVEHFVKTRILRSPQYLAISICATFVNVSFNQTLNCA